MNKIELQIADIAPSGSTSGAYALVLSETHGSRKLPIVIGGNEAQAIAIEMEKMVPSRPLTHDLFRSFAQGFGIEVTEILIYNLVEGIFYSKIIASSKGQQVEIDARTSDAVAIAVRFNCPIYCNESILEQAGVNAEDAELTGLEPDVDIDELTVSGDTSTMKLEDLQRQLAQAIEREDYERASQIRDELKRRGQK